MSWGYPWLTAGITEVPMDVARQLAYDAAGGHEGVTGPADLAVRATTVASSQVRVMPGSATIIGTATGQFNEAYAARNTGEDLSPAISATPASGGRSDLVYAHVTDPDQAGNPLTAAPVETRVVEGVTNTTKSVADAKAQGKLDSNVTGYALARIDRTTANNGVVAQADIVDLRQLVRPRRTEVQRIMNLPDGTTGNALTNTAFVAWPSQAQWSIDIPKWAVRAQLRGDMAGFAIVDANGTNAAGDVRGNFRGKLGTLVTPSTFYNFSLQAGPGRADAAGSMVGEDLYIPKELRGTTQTLAFEANRTAGTPNFRLETSDGQVCIFEIVFYEDPDAQAWEA